MFHLSQKKTIFYIVRVPHACWTNILSAGGGKISSGCHENEICRVSVTGEIGIYSACYLFNLFFLI